jgi:hypothetical protein
VPVPFPGPFGFRRTGTVRLQPAPVFGVLGERDTRLFRGPARQRASGEAFPLTIVCQAWTLPKAVPPMGWAVPSPTKTPYRSYVAEGSPPQPANRYVVKVPATRIAQVFHNVKGSVSQAEVDEKPALPLGLKAQRLAAGSVLSEDLQHPPAQVQDEEEEQGIEQDYSRDQPGARGETPRGARRARNIYRLVSFYIAPHVI